MRKWLIGSMFILTIVVTALVYRSKFELFTIPQDGMAPNYPAGTTHWVTKGRYSANDLALSDVVVFRKDGDKPYYFVCRIVGLPGNEVRVEGESLIVDGLQASRVDQESPDGINWFLETLGDAKYLVQYYDAPANEYRKPIILSVPEEHVFVMGDNRFGSIDSRHYGAIPISSIFGKLKPSQTPKAAD